MMMSYAMLLDGGCVHSCDARPLEGAAVVPLGGESIDFDSSSAAARNKSMHAALQREPFFALRMGELLHEGWHLRPKVLGRPGPIVEIGAADLQPSIRQKGADMRIGLDIASLALMRHEHADLVIDQLDAPQA